MNTAQCVKAIPLVPLENIPDPRLQGPIKLSEKITKGKKIISVFFFTIFFKQLKNFFAEPCACPQGISDDPSPSENMEFLTFMVEDNVEPSRATTPPTSPTKTFKEIPTTQLTRSVADVSGLEVQISNDLLFPSLGHNEAIVSTEEDEIIQKEVQKKDTSSRKKQTKAKPKAKAKGKGKGKKGMAKGKSNSIDKVGKVLSTNPTLLDFKTRKTLIDIEVSPELLQKYSLYFDISIPSVEEKRSMQNLISNIPFEDLLCNGQCRETSTCPYHLSLVHFKRPGEWDTRCSSILVIAQQLRKCEDLYTEQNEQFDFYVMNIFHHKFFVLHYFYKNEDVFAVISHPNAESVFTGHPDFPNIGIVFYKTLFNLLIRQEHVQVIKTNRKFLNMLKNNKQK